MQSTIFELINKRVQGVEGSSCRGTVPVPSTYKSTRTDLLGKKVGISYYCREIVATICGLNLTYPETAYNVTWNKQDNPFENIPADCAGVCSVIHYSQIKDYKFKI